MDTLTRERASSLFSSLANPIRLRIIERLEEGECTVGELALSLGISQSSASQHLAALARTGVLKVEPRGTCRFYQLRGPRIGQILLLIEEFCHIHALYGPSDPPQQESSVNE